MHLRVSILNQLVNPQSINHMVAAWHTYINSAAVRACLCLSTLVVLFRFEFHSTWCVHHSGRHRHGLFTVSLQRQFGHLQKCLFDWSAIDSTRLVKEHVIVFSGPLLSFGSCDLSISFLIQLVSKTDKGERLGILRSRVLIEAIAPPGQCVKGLLVCDVVAQSATISTAIEGVAKRLELFLPSRVPDLQCHNCIVY